MKSTIILFLFSVLNAACVSTHVSESQGSYSGQIATSCVLSRSIQVTGYHGIVCSFENLSHDTIRFKIATVGITEDADLLQENESDMVVEAWQRREQDQLYDRKVGALAVIGFGLFAILSGEPDLMTAGNAAILGTTAYDEAHDASDAYKRNQYGNPADYVSADELFDEELIIPAGFYLRRGFLLKSRQVPEFVDICLSVEKSCQTFTL